MDSPKTYIDKLAWVCIKDKKILNARSRGKDVYFIPGGKREEGETDQEALVREIKEELEAKLLPETIAYLGTFEAQAYGKPEGTLVRMTCYTATAEGKIKPAAEIEELAWLTYNDQDKVTPVSKLLFAYLREKALIE